jgi:hypothetical protein
MIPLQVGDKFKQGTPRDHIRSTEIRWQSYKFNNNNIKSKETGLNVYLG